MRDMFKIFPCTITNDGRKIPLIKDWQQLQSSDPQQHQLWKDQFNGKLSHWGCATGPENDLLVLDVDVKDNGFETLKGLEVPPTAWQRTLSGGAHLLFKYPRDGKVYGNRVRFLKGLDIRGAGGYIIWYGADLSVPTAPPPEFLCKASLKDAPSEGSVVTVASNLSTEIILKSLDAIRTAPEGESNNILNIESFKIGQLVTSGSITRAYAEQVLYKAALDRGKPHYEAQATITSGLDGGIKKPSTVPFPATQPVPLIMMPPLPELPSRWTPSQLTKYALMNTTNLRRPQLFKDWLPRDLVLVAADGGTGKTTLHLNEAISLALGERFIGFDCKEQGKTLFITGEDTAEKLAAMLGAIVRQMGLFNGGEGDQKIQTILDSILIKKDSDLCLISKDRATGFLYPSIEALNKVLEAVEDFKPSVIVFDPISSFWGSESALNDMNKAVCKFMGNLVEKSNAAVIMINHIGKASSNNKDMTQFAGRGGSGLPSHSRVVRSYRAIYEEEYLELTGEQLGENQSCMECVVSKFSDGSPLLMKPFLILRDGFLFARKLLTPQKERELENSLPDNERIMNFVRDSRKHNKYPTGKVIVSHFVGANDSIPQARIKRALETLGFSGHNGEYLKKVDNPDQLSKDVCFVISDAEGKEL